MEEEKENDAEADIECDDDNDNGEDDKIVKKKQKIAEFEKKPKIDIKKKKPLFLRFSNKKKQIMKK